MRLLFALWTRMEDENGRLRHVGTSQIPDPPAVRSVQQVLRVQVLRRPGRGGGVGGGSEVTAGRDQSSGTSRSRSGRDVFHLGFGLVDDGDGERTDQPERADPPTLPCTEGQERCRDSSCKQPVKAAPSTRRRTTRRIARTRSHNLMKLSWSNAHRNKVVSNIGPSRHKESIKCFAWQRADGSKMRMEIT